jgi:4-hydroxythreonine-4-phosphate dehydrogenase
MIAHTQAAVRLALDSAVGGAVGGPHSKKAAEDAGFHFEGYPRLIAEMTGSPHPYLMLVAGALRVSNVTLHVSMRRALEMLDEDLVFHCIEETAKAVSSFGVARPRIAVAGLNPHAGEDRLFGDEDEDVIRPAVERAAALGIDAVGPRPADSLFVGIEDPPYDAYVGMYHDQAHLPVKIVAFKRASAVAIGVPVNWATVDHGCALDIAWQNRADERVLVETIRLVASRAAKRDGGGENR